MPMPSSTQLVAAALCGVLVAGSTGNMAIAATLTPLAEPVALEATDLTTLPESELIANHGGSVGGSAIRAGATTAPVLKATASASQPFALSDSLFANLLLPMAYQRDPEMRKLLKKAGRVNTLTTLSIAGIAGLDLAQSIYSYSHLEPARSLNVTEAHHPGGHDHLHLPTEDRTPATLGIVGSGVTLLTLGVQSVMNKAISVKIAKRQEAIQHEVEHILGHLNTGEASAETRSQLAALVGDRAAGEFLMLWREAQEHKD